MAVLVCPNCSHTQNAPDEYIGRITKCLKCQTQGEITNLNPKSPPAAPPQQYEDAIARMRQQGQIGQFRADWGFLYGEFSVGQSDFEKAFFIAVQELMKRAKLLDADAIIAMRQDIDLDTNGFQFFYLQMYGTAVRMK